MSAVASERGRWRGGAVAHVLRD